MKTERYLSLTILLFAAIVLNAAPRSKQAITKAAMEVLNSGSMFKNRAPRHDSLVVLKTNGAFTVMGYRSGGYAVIGNDDSLPLIMAFSPAKFDTANSGLKWYMDALSGIDVNNAGTPSTPDTSLYHSSVAPFVSTNWTQIYPYNDWCPPVEGSPYNGKAPTGCVATAMAQVIRYNRYPPVGCGKDSVTVPSTKENIVVDFSQSHYDYNNMLDSYNGSYTQAQKDAVCRLMLDCGVAAKMIYRGTSSSSDISKGCSGLKEHFGYGKAVLLKRNKFSEKEWMDIIYNELSCGHAVIYAGTDPETFGGHCFVLDGYREDGLIHINWGWGEDNSGYYSLSILGNDRSYTRNQEMIIGLHGYSAVTDTIDISEPGTLSHYLNSSTAPDIHDLKITGRINSDDVNTLRYYAGRDSSGNITQGRLHSLDLSSAELAEGGSPYLKDSTGTYSVHGNFLPERCFYNCKQLEYLSLPNTLDSIAPTALLGMDNLDSVSTGEGFHVIGNAIYSKDTTLLITVLRKSSGIMYVNRNVVRIGDYAMEGCNLINEVRTYPLLESVGYRAMADMNKLECLRISSTRLPESSGSGIFHNLSPDCVLYTTWRLRSPWDSVHFADIREWGVPVFLSMERTYRKYGEDNPPFTYHLDENRTPKEIIPLVKPYMPATRKSPTGEYRYSVNNDYDGFLDYPAYIYADERMSVQQNTATIIIDTCYVTAGTVNPVFTYSVTDLQNGETEIPEEDWTEKPYIYPSDSIGNGIQADYNTVGNRYILTCRCNSRNYMFKVKDGIAIITDKNADGIEPVETDGTKKRSDGCFYNLSGMKVGENYRGIVIRNGKKYLRR